MRIAVYGGAGAVGTRIVQEAVDRGHRVTVLSRHAAASLPGGAQLRIGDATDPGDVARVAAEHDVIVSAIGPSRSGGRPGLFLEALRTLARDVGAHRLVVVGHAGLLLVAPGLRQLHMASYPEDDLLEARTHLAALEQLEHGGGFVDWVYISPATTMRPGARTGTYRVGSDMVLGDTISLEDYAVAVVDEIERPAHRREQFTVAT